MELDIETSPRQETDLIDDRIMVSGNVTNYTQNKRISLIQNLIPAVKANPGSYTSDTQTFSFNNGGNRVTS